MEADQVTTPKVGEDVTHLINGPQVGDDVTNLMGGPQMNFARANGQDIPVDDEAPIARTWNWLNKPMIAPTAKSTEGARLMAQPGLNDSVGSAQLKGFLSGSGEAAVNLLSGLTSPLSVGLTALTGGANLAEKAGLEKVAQLLHTPGRLAGGGMVVHGGLKAIDRNDEYSMPERVGGGIEAGLGALGLRGLNAGAAQEIETPMSARLNAIPNQQVEPLPTIEPQPIGNVAGKPKLQLAGPTLPEPVQQLRNQLPIAPEHEGLLGGESGKLMIYTRPQSEHPVPAVNNLFNAIRSAKPQVLAQEKLYSAERARRFAAFERTKGMGEVGAQQAMSQLSGELPKVPMNTEYPITQQDADQLFDMIRTSGRITTGEKATAITGLGKILSGGSVPQRSELNVLGRIFGPELPSEVIQMHGGLGMVKGTGKALMETSNLMKTMMASTDVSAPLRQGLPLAYRGEYWRAFDDMFKSLVSEKQFQGLMQSLEERPNYLIGREAGLQLTDLDSITSREEQFLSKVAEKIPGVRASERAYVGFLDKLRADTFDSLLKAGVDAGGKVEEIAPAIAKFVNVSTGRGSLRGLEPIADQLNAVLFSPRLISSRLTMLNPAYYVNQTPQLRREAIKALFSVAAGGLTINGLSKIALDAMGKKSSFSMNPFGHDYGAKLPDWAGGIEGPKIFSRDVISADFGKLHAGNTRLDPNAAFQQYIVAAARLLTNKTASTTSDRVSELGKDVTPSRVGLMIGFGNPYQKSFLENKLSPMAGLVDTLLTAKVGGQPVNVSKEVKDRFIPLFVQDVMDVMKDDPSLIPLTIPAAFGSGLQTYQSR